MKYFKGLLFTVGALLILSGCQTKAVNENGKKTEAVTGKISIKHLAEDDPKTQLAQVVANSTEFHTFEYRLPKGIKSYQVYVDHYENGEKVETMIVEESEIANREGLFFFNLSELPSLEEEEEEADIRYYYTFGSYSEDSYITGGTEEFLEDYLILFNTKFELDKNGTYPLLAFRHAYKIADIPEDVESVTVSQLSNTFLYEPEAELKATKDLSKILLYRVEFSEKDLLPIK